LVQIWSNNYGSSQSSFGSIVYCLGSDLVLLLTVFLPLVQEIHDDAVNITHVFLIVVLVLLSSELKLKPKSFPES